MHVRLYLPGINAHALLYSLNNNQNEKQKELRFELFVRMVVLCIEYVALCVYSNKKRYLENACAVRLSRR
jgi:hypothetical protein